MAHAHFVDPAVSHWYHCVSRGVRRAFLLGEGEHDRKAWIEDRIRELAPAPGRGPSSMSPMRSTFRPGEIAHSS